MFSEIYQKSRDSSIFQLFPYASKDYDEENIKDTGLFYFDEKKKKYISRFRNRIIFPINIISGNIVGFGGRIIEDNKN